MVQIQDPLGRCHFGTLDLHLKVVRTTTQCYIPNFKRSEEKRIFLNIPMYFYGLAQGPMGRAILESETFILVKGYYSMLQTKFQASEPSGSEEDFFIFFYVFPWFKSRTTDAGPF